MTEQHLDDAYVSAGLEQVGRKAVPQCVYRHRLGQIGASCRDPASLLQRGNADRLPPPPAGEQATGRPGPPPGGKPASGPAGPAANRRAGSATAAATA